MTDRIGILGGGQLAQMLAQAAISLGLSTAIFERQPDSPASRLTQHNVVGAWDDPSALDAFAALAPIVTLENEFVDAAVLAALAARGLTVRPGAATLALVQDKLVQKQRMATCGIAVAPFRAVAAPDDVARVADELGWPLVLKARRDGYDGRGNATVSGPADVVSAWGRLGGHAGKALYVEAFVPFRAELAIMVVRGVTGEMRCYPVVQTEQQNHICQRVLAPAPIGAAASEQALALACAAVEAVDGVGIFGVELFLSYAGEIIYNEMAPRPHNSGHYTIEACVTSQFENHLRAVLGLPLGSTALRAPAAAMVNLLGHSSGTGALLDNGAALAVEGAHLHLYGKRILQPGRKMGHVTALGDTLDEALAIAERAAALVAL